MTLTSLIWKIERVLIKARCSRCQYHVPNSCTKLGRCAYCKSNVRVEENGNCMYYQRFKGGYIG